jgi:uncharacterized protein YdeI (BOF family)
MYMKRFALAIALIAALSLSSVALAAGTLSGTYKTKVNTTAQGGFLNGTWTIKFKSGHYTVTDNGTVVIHGKDKIKGSKITFQDVSGKFACVGKKSAGTYKFKLTGKKLKFTKVKESTKSCGQGRAVVLTSSTFTKVG